MKYEVIGYEDYYRDKEGDWCFPSGKKVIHVVKNRRSANAWVQVIDDWEKKQ